MTDASLLNLGESVLDGKVSIPGSRAPRAAAVLARQALEQIIDRLCDSEARGLARATMRSKLIILTAEAGSDDGSRAEIAWAGLSQACHHHSYELQPTAGEVRDLIALTRSLDPDLPLVGRVSTADASH